jgi:hypothetical protein
MWNFVIQVSTALRELVQRLRRLRILDRPACPPNSAALPEGNQEPYEVIANAKLRSATTLMASLVTTITPGVLATFNKSAYVSTAKASKVLLLYPGKLFFLRARG